METLTIIFIGFTIFILTLCVLLYLYTNQRQKGINEENIPFSNKKYHAVQTIKVSFFKKYKMNKASEVNIYTNNFNGNILVTSSDFSDDLFDNFTKVRTTTLKELYKHLDFPNRTERLIIHNDNLRPIIRLNWVITQPNQLDKSSDYIKHNKGGFWITK